MTSVSLRSFGLFAMALSLTLFVPHTMWGQYGAGTILGTITDPTEAVVPGAEVTARNMSTGEVRTFTSDSFGAYRFNALLSGTYAITAAAPSFRTATASNVTLLVNSQVRVDFVMEVGAVAETVEVTGTIPQLQTDTAALGTVIDNRTMLELPLNARNFFDLIALTPGTVKVVGGSSVMDGRSIEIGGIRNTSTNAMLDGVDFSVMNINNPAVALSLDTIDEFKVQMNFMDATYGHGAAGIDMVTKRGGNDFHGTLYDFVRNRAFQAQQFFAPPQGAPRFTYNQFGGSAGGAIAKDKTFYFANYEGRRRITGVILQGLVPTTAQQQGDFSELGKTIKDPLNNNQPFPQNVIPRDRFNTISEKMLEVFPAPNFSGRAGVNFLTAPSDSERRDQFTFRVDHKLSEKGNLFGRYTFADNDLVNIAYRDGKGLLRPDRTQNAALGYTYLFSPNLISETRLGFTKAYLARERFGEKLPNNVVAELGFKNLVAEEGMYAFPCLNLTGYAPGNPTGTPGFGGYCLRIVQNNIYYRLGEAMTYIRNRHTVKFGGDVSRVMVGYDQGNLQNGTHNFSGNFTGDSFGDYLLGFPITSQGGVGSVDPTLGGVAKYSIGTQFQWYVQDDWKLTDRLTLNLGVRHEIFQQWRGRLAWFDIPTRRQLLANTPDYYAVGQGLVRGSGEPLLPERPINTDWNDIGPRLGLAYRLKEKTVVRAGAGVFYALNAGGQTLVGLTSTVPFFVFSTVVSNPTTPEVSLSNLFPTAAESAGGINDNIDLNKRTGYIYQYNFNIQHQLTPGLLFETGYIGSTGHKQTGSVFLNQPRLPDNPANPGPFSSRQPYPDLLQTFFQDTNHDWTNYNAVFFKLEKRATSGHSYSVAYTFAKTLDSGGAGQNMYNRRPERGIADNHVPHNFVAAYVWEIPIGRGKKYDMSNAFLNGVIGGWQLSGITNFQSGRYMTIVTSGDLARVGTGGQRANATGVQPQKLDPRTNNLRGFDTSAYSLPAIGTFGNLSRATQQGFGINNWDVSINKNFPISKLGEAARLQLRFEFFNALNHTQFRGIGTNASVPASFGIVNSTDDPRILQIAAKLYW